MNRKDSLFVILCQCILKKSPVNTLLNHILPLGNSWGTDPDGTSCTGCGPQEEFYGCSDIAVEGDTTGTAQPPTIHPTTTAAPQQTPEPTTTAAPTPTPQPTITSTAQPTTSTARPTTLSPRPTNPAATSSPVVQWTCTAVVNSGATDFWCESNCKHTPSNCPPSHCECGLVEKWTCKAVVIYGATDEWCNTNCNHNPPFCPSTHCTCYKQLVQHSQRQQLVRQLLKLLRRNYW